MSIFEYDKEKHLNQEREAAYQKGKSDGYEIGITVGIELKLFLQVCKKLAKGNTAAQIADALEGAEDVIHALCEKATAYAPEYDERKIIEDWRSAHL
ncbi:MAG: hypothetical protein K2K21_17505 [Lachnospiraceae bacterium]|nr:hypothetical protein [Lachnospiraceae bacterium]